MKDAKQTDSRTTPYRKNKTKTTDTDKAISSRMMEA